MQQGSKKATKMLQLWRDSVREDEFTYSVLAAALEKQGFRHLAREYCYTSSMCTGEYTLTSSFVYICPGLVNGGGGGGGG